jgi:hypothetical protein
MAASPPLPSEFERKDGPMQSDKSGSPKLLPCPCCGSSAEFKVVDDLPNINHGGQFVECSNVARCGVTTRLIFPLKDDVSRELAEVWNRRDVASAELHRWIPVGEREPQAGQNIIVHGVDDLYEVVHDYMPGLPVLEDCTHWMPLPEAPK